MFLWKNAIVVIAMLALACGPVLGLARANWERDNVTKLAGAGVVAICITLSFLPGPLCQIVFGALLLMCLDRRMPMIATYLFFLTWTPAAATFLKAGSAYLVPLRPIISFALALWIGYLMHPRLRLKRRVNMADIYLLAFLLIYCICLSLRDSGTAALRNFVMYMLPYGLTYQILSRMRIERPELVLRIFVLAAAAAGALCFFESVRYWPVYSGLAPMKGVWLLVDTPDMMLIRSGFFRAYGPFSHPLTASAVLGMGGVALFGLICMRGFKPYLVLLGLVVLLGLFGTVSRTGIVVLAVGLMTVQLLRKRYGAVAAVTLIGMIVVLGTPFLSSQDAQNNGLYRLSLITGVPRALGSRLIFGYREAVESHLLDAFVQGQGIVDLVNVYLSIAVTGGLVSLIPYLLFLGTTFTQYRALRRAGPDKEQLLLAQSCVGMQAGFMVAGFFMGAWGTAMQISFLCVAVLVALRTELANHRPQPVKRGAPAPAPDGLERLPVLT